MRLSLNGLVSVVTTLVLATLLTGCPRRGASRGDTGTDPAVPEVVALERTLEVPLHDGKTAALGATLFRPDDDGASLPAILFVPGGGNVSRAGIQPGDGARNYEAPVDVTTQWATAFAERGYLALAYDKRTCTPRDDRGCRKNPTNDLDKEGPAALARDVDAACALLADEQGFDGRLVLFAHGQAAAVALSSSCAERAAAIVLVAPIPRRVDHVMVDSLTHRERELRAEAKKRAGTPAAEKLLQQANVLRNVAASRAATFESMHKGQFADDARVHGATIAFWQGWVALTEKAADDVTKTAAPRVIVVGSDDLQYAPKDRAAILALGELDGVTALQIERADHHLLVDERLEVATVETVRAAVDDALAARPAPAL